MLSLAKVEGFTKIWLLIFFVALVEAANPLPEHIEHPFRHLAAWLKDVEPDMATTDVKALSRGITVLSKSQGALKSVDGMAHELGGRFATAASTAAAIELKEQATASGDAEIAKEALRLMELLLVIENGLSGAELAEIAEADDSSLAEGFIKDAGLLPLPALRPPAPTPANSSAEINVVSLAGEELMHEKPSEAEGAQRIDFSAGVGDVVPDDEETIERTVDMIEVPVGSSAGVVRCRLLLDEVNKNIIVAVGDTLKGSELLRCLYELPAEVPLRPHGLVSETLHVLPSAWDVAMKVIEAAGPHIANFLSNERGKGFRVRCAGHSFGGAVAALIAGLLDGVLAPSKEEGGDTAGIAVAHRRIDCVTFGCPPCVSRTVQLPFITSFVLGDDMIPRSSRQSLERLQKRLSGLVGKGAFARSFALGTALFTDVAGVALQGVRQKGAADSEEEALVVPGKLWFAKPRRLNGAATLTRLRAGALRDDVLWQVHDVMLTKSMLSHHRLGRYIEALDKC